ncbi:MAG: hypothetical protein KA122_04485 [Verrucomicrobia bacterium]|jgi:general secretion pathway protein D|nr:hypothetical protein [Verrucomicrobiota bacterium]HRY59218.1 secretin N-terminal domain-containing protein [Candidatus Paceibacterota bacterium]HNR71075.1 secretin N-terminal domain-containing protein [Verrucomicrobiota bacterium]HNS69704.1 secretin N-terminal domain-containing protein [Verrucomicrobiota bacterium]HNZ75591.1 secretin N-terminal domain-containing protein [Verrucomicrobiota bacterium]
MLVLLGALLAGGLPAGGAVPPEIDPGALEEDDGTLDFGDPTNNGNLVSDCSQSQIQEFLAAVREGGTVELTDCPRLVLTNAVAITTDVTLRGDEDGKTTITGNNLSRMFTVYPRGCLTLENLTLQGGLSRYGGAIYNMAGGRVVLNNCRIVGNQAVGRNGVNGRNGDNDPNYGKKGKSASSGQSGAGGGIYNLGNLEATDCQFTDNRAKGGHGGDGGNGGEGRYQGGNGGDGGDGALAFGGAIYSEGRLWLTNCQFHTNAATGGNGGRGGSPGTSVFAGYDGTGGAGAEGSGAAIYSAGGMVLSNCAFFGNTARGGNSAAAGEAGGGYGVNGADGGYSYGGAVCLLGDGRLIHCDFANNTAAGGMGGDGGPGRYVAGNGGNGGKAVGGCLYNYGGARLVDCFLTNCAAIGGSNGVGGSAPFAGKDGRPRGADDKSMRVRESETIRAASLPEGAVPAATGVATVLLAEHPVAAESARNTPPQAGLSPADSKAANLPPGLPAHLVGTNLLVKPRASTAETNGSPPALPAAGNRSPSSPGGPFTPVAGPAVPPGPGSGLPSRGSAASLEAPLPEGMIDFREADLKQVLDIYSDMVQRTVLRPATLPAPTITLSTRGHLTLGEGIQALEAVLALNGIVMVNVGEKFVKALPEAQGISSGARFDTNSAAQMPELGQYVTHIVQLKYVRPSEMVAVLTPFGKIPNAILPIDSSQILVLRDYTENIKRMLELIEKVDVVIPSEYVSEVIPIKYAQAVEIANALSSLSSGGGGATVGSTGTGTSRSSRSTGINRPGSMTGMSGYPGQQPMTGMATPPGRAGTPAAGAGGSTFTQRLQNIINRASQEGEIQVLGQTKIISDERTNSLLVYATREDMKVIKEIVGKLDVVLAQVLIEAAIIEVTLSDSRDLGFSYLQRPQHTGKWTGVGAINYNNMLQPGGFAGGGGTNNPVGQGFNYLMSWNQDLDATVTALASDSRARILQRPRIQTSHNEPASLFVGESRPYPTSSYYGGGAYGGYSSINQLQIGVTLEVTPLINPDGLVVMEIQQQIDSFQGNVTIQNVGDVPITSSKIASTKVSVRDHDTIIVGGLVETQKNKNASGVPYLKDVPLLGYLFRSTHAAETRKELLVLIRPTVLPTPEVAALAATAEKNKLPGVRETEHELRTEEIRRLKAADKAEKNKPASSRLAP